MDGDGEAAAPAFAGAILAILAAAATVAITHVAAIMTRLAISHSREFMADAGAVELTKNLDALISVLAKISGHDTVPLMSESFRAWMISSAFDADDPVEALFSTHPTIAARIGRLVDFAGGRRIALEARGSLRSTSGALAADAAPGMAARFSAGGGKSFGRRQSIRA